MPNLNLTSLIDVVFLLIVFFMTASRFTDPARDIDLKLPEVAEGDSLSMAEKAREVVVHVDGRVTLDGEAVAVADLTPRLRDAVSTGRPPSVVILGDAGAPFQHIAEAMAACKEAGILDLAVSVQVADGTGTAGAAAQRR